MIAEPTAAERERDEYKRWRDAVDDALVCCEMVASEDPRESLNRLICWNNQVALDPLVSEEASKLRDTFKAERDELRIEIERLKGPPTQEEINTFIANGGLRSNAKNVRGV